MSDALRHPSGRPVGETVTVGGPVDRCAVSLRVFGDDLDPDEISVLLGASPTTAARKGEVFVGKRYDRIEKRGKWLLQVESADCLDAAIAVVLDSTTDDLVVWGQVGARFDVDVFCGLFLEDWNRGCDLGVDTLRRLADRGLPLSLDIYANTDLDEEPTPSG